MPLLQKEIGRAIQRARQSKGLSQERFADVVGVHRTYMGAVERGEKNVGIQNLERIAKALKIPLSAIIADAESASKRPG